MRAPTSPVLAMVEVVRHFHRPGARIRAVDGVSLELIPGEIVGVVGPNGAGKTTLFRLAAGLLRPDAGSVRVAGAPPGSLAARRALGFAPDGPMFPPTLTVREVLDYYARLHVPGARRRALVGEALELGGLDAVVGQRAAQLSKAFVQRLALAQAALGDRRVLLLDETLSGVDPLVRRALGERLQRLAVRGVAMLLASNDVAALERLVARVLVMRGGKVVREGPLGALMRERVLEIVLDAPPGAPPPGFRVTPAGLEVDLGHGTVEAALAVCRAHRLAVRASRVRLKCLEEVVLDALDDAAR